MKRIIVAGMAALTLAGCADYHPEHWSKAGGSAQGYDDDVTACENASRRNDTLGEYVFGGFRYDMRYNDCMTGHGWKHSVKWLG